MFLLLLGLPHDAIHDDLFEEKVYRDIDYMVITTSSNTLGKQPPCVVQVTKTQLYFANHHIIISQRHATPTLDLNKSR
jgi:hypothetical protein